MKKYLVVLLLVPGIYTQAQVGIGTTTPNLTVDGSRSGSANFRLNNQVENSDTYQKPPSNLKQIAGILLK